MNFEKLKQELSSELLDDSKERYEFTWPDKRKAILNAITPTNKTLRPNREESKDFDTTQNLYIEGDNLEVLKLLQKTYLGKVKMIYIDPPYNTGNDFIYQDNFKQSQDDYNEQSSDYDDDGNRLVSNPSSNGRFHTDWLNMIYPRLKLARDLLTDDGVIFISIDDNEYANLEKICDEIFGTENHLETFHIQVRYANKSLNEKDNFQKLIEYCLIYSKNKNLFLPKLPSEEYDLSKFCYEIKELKKGKKVVLGGKNVEIFYEGDYSIIKTSDTGIGKLKATWASGSVLKGNTSGKFFDNYLSTRKNLDGLSVLYKVYGIGEDGLGFRYFTGPKKETATQGLFYSGVPLERVNELNRGNSTKKAPIINYYDYSPDFGNIRHEGGLSFNSGKKPIKMLKNFINISNLDDNDIILDFFSGSSSTAHAVISYNYENNANLKFIMVQLPENCENKSEEFKNICEIGKERIRRAGQKIKDESPLTTQNLDVGFRVLKVDSSNMKDVFYKPSEVTGDIFDNAINNIKEDRTGEDLLFQVLLDMGISLSSKIEKKKIKNKEVFYVYAEDEKFLIASFDRTLNDEVVTEIAKEKPQYFVMRDTDDDKVRINFEQIFKAYSPDTTRKVL